MVPAMDGLQSFLGHTVREEGGNPAGRVPEGGQVSESVAGGDLPAPEERGREKTGAQSPSGRFLGFYDRLRASILRRVEKRGGRLGEGLARALLLVPDVFMLLVRLALDDRVPKPARALIGGALAYFLLPTDLWPEAFVGPLGYLEDLVLASAVLTHAFSHDLDRYTREHWSGPEELRVVVRDVVQGAHALLGADLYGRLKRLLARRGIELRE